METCALTRRRAVLIYTVQAVTNHLVRAGTLCEHICQTIAETADGKRGLEVGVALAVHYLERIADHGVDIGERTVFLVSGERMESAMHQYRDRQLDQYDD